MAAKVQQFRPVRLMTGQKIRRLAA